jgi:hypothetical protein
MAKFLLAAVITITLLGGAAYAEFLMPTASFTCLSVCN